MPHTSDEMLISMHPLVALKLLCNGAEESSGIKKRHKKWKPIQRQSQQKCDRMVLCKWYLLSLSWKIIPSDS